MTRYVASLVTALVGFLLASTASAATYLECLVDFERHAETIWHTATHTNAPTDSGYFGDGNSTGNGGIRGSCGIAIAYAVLANAFPDDPKRTNRLARVRQALNYAANTHVSGTNVAKNGSKWGHDWQSALWAGSMGLACVLVENDLPTNTVSAVQRAVADEATHRAGIPPASGYIGDSKAEENGWNANVVSLAAAWLPGNTNATLWLTSAKKYLANTYTVANTNGDPLASWITTTTLYPSFAMENHGFYHPTYQMVSGMSMGDSLLMARLANPAVAAELQPFAEHNVLNVWNMLGKLVADSGEFIYPSGLDWALHDYEQNSYYAWLAHHFNDPLARYADSNMVQLVRHRQIVNGDGRFVGESEANGFYREAVEARRTAIAWLHQQHADFPIGPIAPPIPQISHFSDVKLITQRSASGFVSISYGPKIMAVIEPSMESLPTNIFLTTPKLNSILGQGALGNPASAQLVSFVTNGNGFDAELTLQHGTQGATEVFIKSTGETVAIVEVPVPAAGVSTNSAGSFTVGIENDPLTGGSRVLEWSGGSANVTNRSGATHHITNHWLCVSGRYGIAAGPAGYFRYQAASSYNRLGAAEDSLQFRTTNNLSPRFAVWFPGKNSSQIAADAALISWNVTSSNVVLTFPGVDGSLQQIVTSPPRPPPPYAPYLIPVANITASSSQPAFLPTNAIDGNVATFWVSSGTAAGQGPTPANPEWLNFSLPRVAAISQFQIAPRTLNGGYGPKNIEMFLDGVSVFQGTMAGTSNLTVQLSPPVYATNAFLLITSSYDPSFPTNSRNVQIVEANFYERALPGTFGDWILNHFSEAQWSDTNVSGAAADPDGDGAANLVEFATGGQPNFSNAANSALQSFVSANGNLVLRFNERTNLAGVVREIFSSTNLTSWNLEIPSQETTVETLGNIQVREAAFEMQNVPRFFKIGYHEQP